MVPATVPATPPPAKKRRDTKGEQSRNDARVEEEITVYDDLDTDDVDFGEDEGEEPEDVAGWRIEYKKPHPRKDGGFSIYFSYRSRKTFVNPETGKRSTRYKKGGVIRR